MLYENIRYSRRSFPFICSKMEGDLPFMNHCHKEMEMILILRGQIGVCCEGEKYRLNAGDVWIVPPFASHSIDSSNPDSQRLAVLIALDIMGEMKQEESVSEMEELLETTDLYSGHWEPEVQAEVRALIVQMCQEYIHSEPGWRLAIKTALNHFLLIALRRMPRCDRRAAFRRVDKLRTILEYVAVNYCGEISLEGCARAAGFHPTYLSRYFHKHMGMTFQEYIKKLRIERARWLLTSRTMTITEVSGASGYRDIKTFNKQFKKECGVSPSEFRRQASGTSAQKG